MKILYVTTISLTMNSFFKPHIKMLVEEGHKVDVACNDTDLPVDAFFEELECQVFHIPFSRSVVSKENIKAYRQIKALIQREKYDIVHTHTPNASAIVRFACRKMRKKGLKVIYTAHGFYFCKGSPKRNWILFYPIEKICSHWTDILITINTEDYALAKKRMKACRVEYVPGVGIDLSKFDRLGIDKAKKRSEIGVPEDSILLLSVGELNGNKNHETVIRALSRLTEKNIYYVVAGKGEKADRLIEVAKEIGVSDRVKLLGFRNDVNELLETADVYILPSFREGLNVSLMEAMSKGLPCIAGNIRGNVDLIDENGSNLFEPCSVDSCKKAIENTLSMSTEKVRAYNKEKIKHFSLDSVRKMLKHGIYGTD